MRTVSHSLSCSNRNAVAMHTGDRRECRNTRFCARREAAVLRDWRPRTRSLVDPGFPSSGAMPINPGRSHKRDSDLFPHVTFRLSYITGTLAFSSCNCEFLTRGKAAAATERPLPSLQTYSDCSGWTVRSRIDGRPKIHDRFRI